ncbi:MAG: hypothetical protein IJZ75_01935 [Clostridia bacterium]|nr:hypothetical protein [Clostridia bacterium]
MFLAFEASNFIKNLGYMGKGMLSIGIVMLILILVTVLLNKITSGKKNK